MSSPRRKAAPRPRERGIALLSALFTVALLTVIVIEMTDATLVHSHLTRNAGNAMAAQLLARTAETAGEWLVSDKTANPTDYTCTKSAWALPVSDIPVGSGMVFLQVTDEGGKLDLNSVGTEAYASAARQLFQTLGLDPGLVDEIKAWISRPADATMETGQASDYCALSMPCAVPHKPLESLEELALIRGFDEQAIARLRPFATAIPRGDGRAGAPIKVNPLTARPEVLQALGCEGNVQVPDCPAGLGGTDDQKSKDFRVEYDQWQTAHCKTAANLLAINSSYFSIDARGMVGDMEQGLRVLVRRAGNKPQVLSWQERPASDALPAEVR